MESMSINQINVMRRISLRKGKETRNFLAHAINVVRWGTSLQTALKIKQIKTRGLCLGYFND